MWDYFRASPWSSRSRIAFTVATLTAGVLGVMAFFTLAGTSAVERAHPATGHLVPVAGGVLHVVEKSPPGGVAADRPAVVIVHGAAANLHDQENALGERLSAGYRVLLVDRPGHGWSTQGRGPSANTPRAQAAVLHAALQQLGITSFILIGHSWGGTLAAAYALDFPQDLAGLILLAPVAYPWSGGTSWYYDIGALPVVGPVFAHVVAMPVGMLLIPGAVSMVFAPNTPQPGYVDRAATTLVLRPSEFLATSAEVTGLKPFVTVQASRYRNLKTPTVIISGDADTIVPPGVHAQPLAAVLPNAKLVMLPGVGHMPHYAAPERIEEAVAELARGGEPK